MANTISITDTTLRDGQQSLWAFRMRTDWMVPVIERQERSGVATVDVTGHAHFLSMVRYLQENPWDRIRCFRRLLSTPALSASSGEVIGIFNVAPRDIRRLFIEGCVRNGIDVIREMHGLLDTENMIEYLRFAKECGARTLAALVYSDSPVHTDELYEQCARELVDGADIDWLMIKDSGGLLTPERAGSLIDAIRRGAGDTKVTLHSHCNAGMAHRVYMIGAEHEVDDLQCSIWPLALGSAQPSIQTIVRNLRELDYTVDIDDEEVHVASDYLVQLARRQRLPLGAPLEYDHLHYRHQIPGGMWSNLETQLRSAGLLERLPELLRETSRVRAELGWPIMVTPYSQFVVNQAVMNLVTGERYGSIPDQVKMYALGYYGRLLAPVDPDVMDRVMENGSKAVGPEVNEVPDVLPELRRRYPKADDEELLLRYMCSESEVDAIVKSPDSGRSPEAGRNLSPAARQAIDLLGRIAALSDFSELVVEDEGVSMRVVRR